MERTRDVLGEALTFQDLLLPKVTLNAIRNAGFLRPSPVQHAAIPLARLGVDLIVQAKAGTGKTLVFAVAAVEKVDIQTTFPQVLVLAPTREIALQATEVLTTIAGPQPVRIGTFIGGLPTSEDEIVLRRTCHIVVGTPGRLLALLKRGALVLSRVHTLILDEADKLLGDAFKKDVFKLINALPKERQSMALSATFDPDSLQLLRGMMRQPREVSLCGDTLALLGVRQYYLIVPQQEETEGNAAEAHDAAALVSLLNRIPFSQAMVFCSSITAADTLASRFAASGLPAAALSSAHTQLDRIAVLNSLRDFRLRVVVSTDVAARGVDLDRVTLVINQGLPGDAATYMHRVGRAGRFGTTGVAVTVVESEGEVARLRRFVEEVGGGDVEPLPCGEGALLDLKEERYPSSSGGTSTGGVVRVSGGSEPVGKVLREHQGSPGGKSDRQNSRDDTAVGPLLTTACHFNDISKVTLWPDRPGYPTTTTWPLSLEQYLGVPPVKAAVDGRSDGDSAHNKAAGDRPATPAAFEPLACSPSPSSPPREPVDIHTEGLREAFTRSGGVNHFEGVVRSAQLDVLATPASTRDSAEALAAAFRGFIPEPPQATKAQLPYTISEAAGTFLQHDTPNSSTPAPSQAPVSPRDPSTGDAWQPSSVPGRHRAPLGSRQVHSYTRQLEEEAEIQAALDATYGPEAAEAAEGSTHGEEYTDEWEDDYESGAPDEYTGDTGNEEAWRQYWQHHYDMYGYYPGGDGGGQAQSVPRDISHAPALETSDQHGATGQVAVSVDLFHRYQVLEWQDWARKYEEWQLAFERWKLRCDALPSPSTPQ